MNPDGIFYWFLQPGLFITDLSLRHELPDQVRNDIFPEGFIPEYMDVRRINWML